MEHISGQQFAKLKDVLNFVWKNPYSDFYTRKFMAAGIKPDDIKTPDDIQRLPLTTRDELAGDPFERLFFDEKDICSVRCTSGTSGRGCVVKFRAWSEMIERMPIFDEMPDVKRILFLQQPSMATPYYERCRRNMKTLVIGDRHDLPASAMIASKMRIDSITTMPALALVFAEYLKKMYDMNKIRAVDLQGESVTKGMRKMLRNAYPNAVILNNYGLVELGIVGMRCPEMNEELCNVFHIPPEIFLCEIVEPETGKPCGKGELVITRLERIIMPMIRYRTGDLAELADSKCACGRPGPMFRILGRANFDVIRAGGVELYAEKIEEAVSSQSAFLTGDFQAHIYEETAGDTVKPRMVINVVLRDSLKGRGEKLRKGIAERVSEGISKSLKISPRFTLSQAVEAGMFLPLGINLVDRIEHGLKSRKIVDHRI